jgi:hypothetical protein
MDVLLTRMRKVKKSDGVFSHEVAFLINSAVRTSNLAMTTIITSLLTRVFRWSVQPIGRCREMHQ